MTLYRFDPAAGTAIDAYDSSFVLARLARSDGTTLRAACFHLAPAGTPSTPGRSSATQVCRPSRRRRGTRD